MAGRDRVLEVRELSARAAPPRAGLVTRDVLLGRPWERCREDKDGTVFTGRTVTPRVFITHSYCTQWSRDSGRFGIR